MGEPSKQQVETFFKNSFSVGNNLDVKIYSYGYEYVQDMNAFEGSSFDMVDAGYGDERSLENVLEQEFENCSMFVINKHEFLGARKRQKNLLRILEFKFSHHNPVQVKHKFFQKDLLNNQASKVYADFCDELDKKIFESRQAAIAWLKDSKKLKKFCNALSACSENVTAQKLEYCVSRCALMDYREIIDAKNEGDAIVYCLGGNCIEKLCYE